MPKLIMVFNDTQMILELFEDILTTEGYEVSLHSYSVLDLKVIKEVKPDLIISDHPPIENKEKEGWQLVQALRMDHETAKLPVIICTTDVKKAEESEGHLMAKGMVVLPKPFDIDELVAAVENLIGKADAPRLTELNPVEQQKSKAEKNHS